MKQLLISFGAAACIAAGLAARVPQSDAPQATFRGSVELVDVDVSVLDEDRLPVTGLKASDFVILEDGKPRPVAAFAAVDLPRRERSSADWMDMVAPDVVTNALPPAGRLVAIVFDQSLDLSQLPAARKVAVAAVDQLRPGDLAAVVYTHLGVPQGFTSDRGLLTSAIERPFAVLPEGDGASRAECYCGACSLDTIANIAESLRDVRERRRVILYLGPRLPAFSTTATCSGVLEISRTRALQALDLGNTTVHVFDPTGLETRVPSASERGGSSQQMAAASRARRGSLELLPSHTGGRTVTLAADALEVPGVLRESTSYYVLGFEPASGDRREHDISVRLPGRDVIVQARKRYRIGDPASDKPPAWAKNLPIPAPLWRAVADMWPKVGLGVEMAAVPFALPGLKDATVAVVLSVRQPLDPEQLARLRADASARPRTIDTIVGAFDRNGVSKGYVRQTIDVPVTQLRGTTLEYEILARLPLRPGRYELRAAVDDAALGTTGSVYTYVVVPDFAQEEVSLSGILLDALPGRATIPGATFTDLFDVTPTARRNFRRTDNVTAFVRENQGVSREVVPGYLTVEIFDDSDRSVFHQERRLLTSDLGANRALDFTIDLPLEKLTVGRYLLSIDVRHGNATARRDAQFRVE